jgi:hypothetical protein
MVLNAHNARYVYVYAHDAYSYGIKVSTSAEQHISVNVLARFHCARLHSLKTAKLLNGVDVVWSS